MLTPQQEKFKKSLISAWPSGIVCRGQFKQFSGGLYSPGTIANADSKGVGIARLTAQSQKCVYLVEDAAEWVARRLIEPDFKHQTHRKLNQSTSKREVLK